MNLTLLGLILNALGAFLLVFFTSPGLDVTRTGQNSMSWVNDPLPEQRAANIKRYRRHAFCFRAGLVLMLLGFLLQIPAALAQGDSGALTCSGTVSYGGESFKDQIVLRFSGREVEVTGAAGVTSTFEGMLPYRICSETENEINFEYTTTQCGSTSTRSGYLQKTLGALHLSRSDRGKPFEGNYKCIRAHPVK